MSRLAKTYSAYACDIFMLPSSYSVFGQRDFSTEKVDLISDSLIDLNPLAEDNYLKTRAHLNKSTFKKGELIKMTVDAMIV
jgi:hypothetical protein